MKTSIAVVVSFWETSVVIMATSRDESNRGSIKQ